MNDVILCALDGSNPLGFLAALGTFRLLKFRNPEARLSWRLDATWHPVLTGLVDSTPEAICQMISDAPPIPIEFIRAALGKDLTVAPDVFRAFGDKCAEDLESGDRRSSDFAAAFGSEVCRDEKKGRIQFTRFCFITGSGHQHFVETAASLLKQVTSEHVSAALFGPIRYDEGLSFRWDPSDAREYALRWSDPGPEGVRSLWGANRLALEALPFFPTHATSKGLITTGFRDAGRWHEFTWPIWAAPISSDSVRALVALDELQKPSPDRECLTAMQIQEVFRAQQVRVGSGANFKWSFRPARAV